LTSGAARAREGRARARRARVARRRFFIEVLLERKQSDREPIASARIGARARDRDLLFPE